MENVLYKVRKNYFNEIARFVPKFDGQIVVVTHLLNDREEMLDAISSIGEIALVIAIPYSIHQPSLKRLKNLGYTIQAPSLSEMTDPAFLQNLIRQYISKHYIIHEIGGYFAEVAANKAIRKDKKLIGIVESTEAGHRRYLHLKKQLNCPVMSVARGSLKWTEYSQVGNSSFFSTEKLLREHGYILTGHKTLVIGYGRVGQGLANRLTSHNCTVSIYDINPIMRVRAFGEGYGVPDKKEALSEAEVIFGTAGGEAICGDEFKWVRNGAILVSCSSKNNEFDIKYLSENYKSELVGDNLTKYTDPISGKKLYMLRHGYPINFIDGAVMGPVLAIVQAEIIYSFKYIIEKAAKKHSGLYEVHEQDREFLASKWLNYFNNRTFGYYADN